MVIISYILGMLCIFGMTAYANTVIEVLNETIVAIGGCEHEINVCTCKERWLKKDAEEIIIKHKKRGYDAIL